MTPVVCCANVVAHMSSRTATAPKSFLVICLQPDAGTCNCRSGTAIVNDHRPVPEHHSLLISRSLRNPQAAADCGILREILIIGPRVGAVPLPDAGQRRLEGAAAAHGRPPPRLHVDQLSRRRARG